MQCTEHEEVQTIAKVDEYFLNQFAFFSKLILDVSTTHKKEEKGEFSSSHNTTLQPQSYS